jgi:hypothetical protein
MRHGLLPQANPAIDQELDELRREFPGWEFTRMMLPGSIRATHPDRALPVTAADVAGLAEALRVVATVRLPGGSGHAARGFGLRPTCDVTSRQPGLCDHR